MKRNRGPSKRGYRFRHFAGQPRNELVILEVPDRVVIPLQQGWGDAVSVTVDPGDLVKAGQIIGQDDRGISSPVHASVSGIVRNIEEALCADGNEKLAVVIESDGSSQWQLLEGHSAAPEDLSPEQLEDLLYISGVSSLGTGGIPTRYRSALIEPQEVKDLIVHGVGAQMYNLSLGVLLKDAGIKKLAIALQILNRIVPAAHIHVALEKAEGRIRQALRELLSDCRWLDFHRVSSAYPQGREEMMIPALVGREFPHGCPAASIGVVVLDFQAALHIYEAVVEGKPLIERTVALCGPGFTEPTHARVRIGAPMTHVLKERTRTELELRLVVDDPLTGPVVPDLSVPLERFFSQIIALPEERTRRFLAFGRPGLHVDSYTRTFLSCAFPSRKQAHTNLGGEKRPCLSCGFCESVCPAGIIPHLLAKHAERDLIDDVLVDYRVFNCIECGLCSYVCPSKVPVAAQIKEGKQKLLADGIDNMRNLRGRSDFKCPADCRGIR